MHTHWFRDRSLTLVLLALCGAFLAGQFLTGFLDYNATQIEHRLPPVTWLAYLQTGHPWEALFENWESEFLQMAVFVLLTVHAPHDETGR